MQEMKINGEVMGFRLRVGEELEDSKVGIGNK